MNGPVRMEIALVVTNDESLCSSLGDLLRERGISVLPFRFSARLPSLVAEYPWDLAILDSDPSARRICRRLKRDPALQDRFVLLLGGSSDDLVPSLDAGADAFLPKPIDQQRVAAQLSSAGRIVTMKRSLMLSNQRLTTLSMTDPLTGVFNRRFFDEHIGIAFRDAVERGHPLSLAMADIDDLKTVNDSRGHPAGDQLLTAVSDILVQFVRADDIVARWGGDEFMLLMKRTQLSEGLRIAERAAAAIAESRIRVGRSEVAATASIGVACAGPGRCTSVEELLLTADAALNRAKSGGRNRVVALERPAEVRPPGAAPPEAERRAD